MVKEDTNNSLKLNKSEKSGASVQERMKNVMGSALLNAIKIKAAKLKNQSPEPRSELSPICYDKL